MKSISMQVHCRTPRVDLLPQRRDKGPTNLPQPVKSAGFQENTGYNQTKLAGLVSIAT